MASFPLSFVYKSLIHAELVSLRCSCLLRCFFQGQDDILMFDVQEEFHPPFLLDRQLAARCSQVASIGSLRLADDELIPL